MRYFATESGKSRGQFYTPAPFHGPSRVIVFDAALELLSLGEPSYRLT